MRTLIPLLVVSLIGCGPNAELRTSTEGQESAQSELRLDNGRVANGRVQNGRVQNGRFQNGRFQNGRVQNGRVQNGFLYGLSLNGASTGGVRDANFDAWFAESGDYAGADREMRYIVKCAAPAGATLRYTALNGVTYTWTGSAGVAPQWVNPNRTYVDPATLAVEQQRVSACLLGLTNSAGMSLPIAIWGLGQVMTNADWATFPNEEGRYFGNLFLATPKAYSCWLMSNFSGFYHKGRTCAADPGTCGMVAAGSCSSVCTTDATGAPATCRGADGLIYPSMESLVQGFQGDGICQYNEPCGIEDCEFDPRCEGHALY